MNICAQIQQCSGVPAARFSERHAGISHAEGMSLQVLYQLLISSKGIVTDWQGNNAAVVDRRGNVVQQTIYYPYGEPTIEPAGQRYLFGGKEREHAGGRNTYDFGARCLTPYGNWGVTDSESERFYPYSPYSYCLGDPVNHVDIEGNVVIFINGMHNGSGGSAKYWDGIDKKAMADLGDYKALYFDGSVGGRRNLINNLSASYRRGVGMEEGYKNAQKILNNLGKEEKIKFITHSMGAAYAKGFISGLKAYGERNNIEVGNKIEFELDLAPFQPGSQTAHSDIPTTVIQHYNDGSAYPKKMVGANNKVTRTEIYPTLLTPITEHSIKSFKNDLINIRKEHFKEK